MKEAELGAPNNIKFSLVLYAEPREQPESKKSSEDYISRKIQADQNIP